LPVFDAQNCPVKMMTTMGPARKLSANEMKRLKGGGGKRLSDVAPVLIGGMMVGARLATTCSTHADCPVLIDCPQLAGQCDSQGCLYGLCS
jgi:hypothetical protein